MAELDAKVTSVFAGKVVRKDLVRTLKGQYPVPTYVVEFLLGRYCASTTEQEAKPTRARNQASRRSVPASSPCAVARIHTANVA